MQRERGLRERGTERNRDGAERGQREKERENEGTEREREGAE